MTEAEIKTRAPKQNENEIVQMPMQTTYSSRQAFSLEPPSFDFYSAPSSFISTSALPPLNIGIVSTSALPTNDNEILS